MFAPRTVLSAALLVALASSAAATPPTRDLNFTIRNASNYAVSELYWSGCDAVEWLPLPLQRGAFPDGLVRPGQSVVYAFNPGCVNVLLVTQEGYEFAYGSEITAYDVYEWVLYDGDAVSNDDYDTGYDEGYGYIEVVNNNGYEAVKDVFLRYCGTEWDSDYLVEGELIHLEQAQAFEIPVGCWDAAVRLTSGQVMNWTDLNVQPDRTVRIGVPPSH